MVGRFGQTMTQCCLALGLSVMLATFAGCGGGSDDDKADTGSASTKSTKSSSGSQKTATAKTETDERPNIGGIPLDVYFDNPLAVASESGTVAGSAVAMTTTTPDSTASTATTEPEPEPEPEPAGGNVNWSELITAENLEGEVKSIRNELNARMTNFGAYKRSTLEIPVFGTTLAFLADIGRRHDGDVSWKEKAHIIRELAVAMVDVTSSSTAGVKKSYDEVNDSFLKICDILDNNDPPGLPDAEPEADFGDFADMGYLMKRLERGSQWLQNNVGSENGFTDNGDLAKREVGVFALISEAFAAEGYGYADYEDFIEWTHGMRDAATGMNKAVDAKNFDEFDTLRSTLNQKCTQCHSVYRNG